MKKAWNAMKEQRFDKRTEKLKKQALQYIQKKEKLERQIAESQGDTAWFPSREENLKATETIAISNDRKCYSIKKKETEKYPKEKAGQDKGEEFSNTIRPDGLGCEK